MPGGMLSVAAADGRRRRHRGARRSPHRLPRRGRRRGGSARRHRPRPCCRGWRGRRRGRSSRPVEGEVGQLGEANARAVASDRGPDRGVGGGTGGARGGSDRDATLCERPAGVEFAPGGGEGEEDPVRVPGGGGEAGVAVELAGEALEALGPVVVLEEERNADISLGPDAVAVGADDLTPLSGAERLRQGSPEFATWWEAHDIRASAAGQKLLSHPEKGLLRFEYATFQANDDPALKLAIYTPV